MQCFKGHVTAISAHISLCFSCVFLFFLDTHEGKFELGWLQICDNSSSCVSACHVSWLPSVSMLCRAQSPHPSSLCDLLRICDSSRKDTFYQPPPFFQLNLLGFVPTITDGSFSADTFPWTGSAGWQAAVRTYKAEQDTHCTLVSPSLLF